MQGFSLFEQINICIWKYKMSTLSWETKNGSIGSFANKSTIDKSLSATNAVEYILITGTLPEGVYLSSDGNIYGYANLDNIETSKNIYVFNFTVRAVDSQNNFLDRNFSLSIVLNLFISVDLSQSRLRYNSNTLQYFISKGSINPNANVFWRLNEGTLPEGINLSPNGSITASIDKNILPLKINQFITQPDINQKLQWDSWLRTFLSGSKEYDFQFSIVLDDSYSASVQSYTVRVIFTKIPNDEYWILQNSDVNIDPNQYYFIFMISEYNYVSWITDDDLGSMSNGTISELSVSAVSKYNDEIVYSVKPFLSSFFPQGMILLKNGLLSGRISFKTYHDDPFLLPANDDYTFTIRASTADGFTYSEKTFRLHVDRVFEKPYDNIWIRSFPERKSRDFLRNIINNEKYFPYDLLYRPEDEWFGRTKLPLRFLFATGLNPSTIEEYYQAIISNHYTKNITVSDVKTAVCLNNDLSVRYEVVYLELQDFLSKFNFQFNVLEGLPDQIDISDYVENFYIENGITYYQFRPNGLINMSKQLSENIGYVNTGILPDWMLSFQPLDDNPYILRAPLGFTPAIVLAYTKPGFSKLIKYRLNQDKINFNNYQFVFDRYELDDSQQQLYDETTGTYVTGPVTEFDNGQTLFEFGSTTFIENLDIGLGGFRGAISGDKYIKFNNLRAIT